MEQAPRNLAPSLWVIDRPFTLPYVGAEIGTRMTCIRLADGRLFLHSPVKLDPVLHNSLDALGEIRAIVAPNKLHHLFLAEYITSYPQAGVYAAPSLSKKRPDLHFIGELGDEPQTEWRGQIEHHLFRGAPALNEVGFAYAAIGNWKEIAMFHHRYILVLAASVTVGLSATANAQDCLKTGCPKDQQATHFIDQDAAGVAIKGYDPVAYFTMGHPVKGSPDIEYVWKDAHWRFSTQEDRDAFIKDPDKFSPQYGGYCAFGVSVNVLADIDPEAWAIMDGKLYLYHRPASLDKFKAAIAENISKANVNWSVLQPKK